MVCTCQGNTSQFILILTAEKTRSHLRIHRAGNLRLRKTGNWEELLPCTMQTRRGLLAPSQWYPSSAQTTGSHPVGQMFEVYFITSKIRLETSNRMILQLEVTATRGEYSSAGGDPVPRPGPTVYLVSVCQLSLSTPRTRTLSPLLFMEEHVKSFGA